LSFFSSDEANLPASKLAEELAEQELYSRAAAEVASGQIRHGLWAKAKAMSGGGEEATEAAYLKLRVEMMRTESDAVAHATGELVKELRQANEREKREREAQAVEREAAAKRELDQRIGKIQAEARQAYLEDTAARKRDTFIWVVVFLPFLLLFLWMLALPLQASEQGCSTAFVCQVVNYQRMYLGGRLEEMSAEPFGFQLVGNQLVPQKGGSPLGDGSLN
jgi:hypothetical protein